MYIDITKLKMLRDVGLEWSIGATDTAECECIISKSDYVSNFNFEIVERADTFDKAIKRAIWMLKCILIKKVELDSAVDAAKSAEVYTRAVNHSKATSIAFKLESMGFYDE